MKLKRLAVGGSLGAFLSALLGAHISGCQSTRYVDHGLVFESHEVVTGRARSQTILPGFFLGGSTADLAVVSVGGGEGRRGRTDGCERGR